MLKRRDFFIRFSTVLGVLGGSSSLPGGFVLARSNDSKKGEIVMKSAQEVLERYKVEINKHDFDLLLPLVSDGCKFWFSSGTHVGLEETRKAFEKTWSMIKSEVYSIKDIEWLAESDKAAVCTYTYHWSGLINGEKREGTGRGTSCFRRENEAWKIVHEHLSPFPKT